MPKVTLKEPLKYKRSPRTGDVWMNPKGRSRFLVVDLPVELRKGQSMEGKVLLLDMDNHYSGLAFTDEVASNWEFLGTVTEYVVQQ